MSRTPFHRLPAFAWLFVALAAVASPLAAQPALTGQPLSTTPVGPLSSVLRTTSEPNAPTGTVERGASTSPSAFTVGLDASYHSVDVETDAAGGRHAVFATFVNVGGTTPVIYAYCAPTAVCDDASAWSRTEIGLNDLYYLQLEVTADGRPRLLSYKAEIEVLGVARHTYYHYSACESGCTSAANWTNVDLWTALNGSTFDASDFSPQSFALDAQGRPRFVYTQDNFRSEAIYAGCDAGCTTPSNWWRRPMPGTSWDELEDSDLEIGPDGRPQIMTTTRDNSGRWAAYATCTGACATAADWTFTPLVVIASDFYCSGAPDACTVSLALDNAGHPRIAFQGPHTNIGYGWCESNCTSADSWVGTGFDIAGGKYPTVATDRAGRTSMVYQKWGVAGGMGYVWCDTDCQGDGAVWMADLFDLSISLQNEFTIPPPSNCVEGEWQLGFRPSLAFLPDGDPLIGHDGEYLMFCASGGHTSYEPRWWTSRIVSFDRPGSVAAEPDVETPSAVAMAPLTPNPTAGPSALSFTLAEAGTAVVDVVDMTGRTVARVADGPFAAGAHRVEIGTAALAPGVYTVRLRAAGTVVTGRLSVVR